MYFFVRYTGYVLIFFGIFLMLGGLTGTVYGFLQYEVLLARINEALYAGNAAWRLVDVRFLTSSLGLALFISGMIVAALGQLLLVFADLASHTRETNILLRSIRSRQRRPASNPPKIARRQDDEPAG